MQGRVEQADELLERWRVAVEGLGDSISLVAINFGFVSPRDDPVAAERELRPGYDALKRIGEKSHFSSIAGLLSLVMCEQGRYDEAERLSQESEEAARPNDIHSHISGAPRAPRSTRTVVSSWRPRHSHVKRWRSRRRATSSTPTATR